jgi:MFS family permease
MSGILQQGYSFGYVLAACCNLGVGGSTDSWKIVFWIGTGLSIAVGLIRILFPESQQFIEARKAGKQSVSPGAFWLETKKMLAKEWRMCIYCIVLMTWFNYVSPPFLFSLGYNTTTTAPSFPPLIHHTNSPSFQQYSHTSQDSYTTFLLTQKEFSNAAASRGSILMKTGACVGGTVIGYLSQWLGRRRAIILSALMSAVLIPAWILPSTEAALSATGFLMQFCVQGAWGVIPIHLNELSPPAFRSSFPGITYQLGNMISSPSAQIVNAVAEKTLVTAVTGDRVEGYGPVMGVATAIIALGIVVTAALGPEKRGAMFEQAKVAGVGEMDLMRKLDPEVGEEKVTEVQVERTKA